MFFVTIIYFDLFVSGCNFQIIVFFLFVFAAFFFVLPLQNCKLRVARLLLMYLLKMFKFLYCIFNGLLIFHAIINFPNVCVRLFFCHHHQ